MGEKDLFEYWSSTYKVAYDWSIEAAKEILNEWQAKFNEEVETLVEEKLYQRKYDINAFSSSYLDETLTKYSEVSWLNSIVTQIGTILYIMLYNVQTTYITFSY